MFLSDLTDKEVFSSKKSKGICRGVGISLKTQEVKYLLCSNAAAEFCISTNYVENISDCIQLSKLRPVHPQRCACVFVGTPVYSSEGSYLGNVTDLALHNFTATQLFTDQNAIYPITAVVACQDAVILRKEQPYPLGQRVPAPLLSALSDKKSPIVTKAILRSAIEKGALISLTLSLPPFSVF